MFSSLSLMLLISVGTFPALATETVRHNTLSNGFIVAQATPPRVVPKASKPKRRLTEAQSFNVTKFINTCDAYDNFLKNHPAGQFAGRARAWKSKNCKSSPLRIESSGIKPAVGQTIQSISKDPVTRAQPKSRSSTKRSPANKRRALKRQQQRRTKRSNTTRKKPKTARAKPAKPRSTPPRTKRPKGPRCRRETTLECIKRGGEFQNGECDRLNRCD